MADNIDYVALDNASHPGHGAAVAAQLAKFAAEEGAAPARVTASAPAPQVFTIGADGKRVYEHLDADGIPVYDPKAPYWNKEHPRHKEAVAEVVGRMRAANPEPDADADAHQAALKAAAGEPVERDDFDMMKLREASGVPPVKFRNPEWNEQMHGDYMAYVVQETIPPRIATAVRDYYVEAVRSRSWDEAESGFRSRFSGKLSDGQINQLIRFARAIHGRGE